MKFPKNTLNRVHGLKVSLFDGRIGIDNNPAENPIRPNVIGRKNWRFMELSWGASSLQYKQPIYIACNYW
ncbi:transposase [Lysinibacillus xylanilyticus]|uniref:IS66 family transposase n=1 Tax=Lysinibacillus xylanilyticus TaxID=582475 RepID=UPI00382B5C09